MNTVDDPHAFHRVHFSQRKKKREEMRERLMNEMKESREKEADEDCRESDDDASGKQTKSWVLKQS